ncbi:MAG: hypothetical protein E7616_05525 [Ruminococcaceae bacterium]|nr:hypothetical protein [Oscillospiraceae bacterium]
MSTMFERFAKMAREEFGVSVVRTTNTETSTFESLFGLSVENVAQYELPYSIPSDQCRYYEAPVSNNMFDLELPTSNFISDNQIAFAA